MPPNSDNLSQSTCPPCRPGTAYLSNLFDKDGNCMTTCQTYAAAAKTYIIVAGLAVGLAIAIWKTIVYHFGHPRPATKDGHDKAKRNE
jgi:hypothetical protein